jgi:hypothetical protein
MFLYKDDADVMTEEMWSDNLEKAVRIQQFICDQVYLSRKKDYDNEIRSTTFRNDAEKIAVVGKIDEVEFIKQTSKDTEEFKQRVENYKKRYNL